jgi:hypothetical protein
MNERDAAALSSMATSLDDIHSSVGALASRYATAKRDDLLAALHEAERTVRTAARELRRAERLLVGD